MQDSNYHRISNIVANNLIITVSSAFSPCYREEKKRQLVVVMQRGAVAAKNFIISMEFWVLARFRGMDRWGGKKSSELMGGGSGSPVSAEKRLKLGRKGGKD